MISLDDLRAVAEREGVDLLGVAPVDRFADAPRGHKPGDLLPGARSVLSIGIHLALALVDWERLFHNSALIPAAQRVLVAQSYLYMRAGYDMVNTRLEQAALRLSLALERAGAQAMHFPATYGQHAWVMEQVPGLFAPFCHRHAAVRAGLGEFGLANLVVTSRYGPRVRFNSVLTTLELKPTPLLAEKVCLGEACGECVTRCGLGALSPRDDLDPDAVWLTMPGRTDKERCYRKHGEAGCIGRCLAVCPIGRE